jgi:serine/threonine-protein kinase
MECLDEETILGFCRGGLSGEARSLAQEHSGTCDECRQLVSAVMRSSFIETPPNERAPESVRGGRAELGPAHAGAEAESEDREDRPPGALLRQRLDPAMAPTTPVGASGRAGPSSSPVQPGEILAGKFEVERVLGQGGMGIVVAARHTQLDQRVALKFLLPIACEVPGAVARFLREGKAAARITSEHVVRVKDTGVLEGGAPYLVMEYLEGSDLGAVVQQRGRIRPDEAMEYVLQACEAIVEAHGLGIVHRDLKPANLFLSRRADGSPLVKVLDFGISKIEGAGSRSQLTSVSMLMGSPRYMSPEQMMSAKDVDARTDVWALGVILYELVTGQPVWNADTMQGLCAQIATTPAPSVRDALPTVPAVLEEVIAHCLVKAREKRLASVADLALALAPIAPAAARTSIDRILRVAGRDREVVTRSVPAPSGAAEAAAALDRARDEARDRALEEARKDAPPRVGVMLGVAVAALLAAGIAINAALAQRTGVHVSSDVGPAIGPAPGAAAAVSAGAPPALGVPVSAPAPFASAPPPVTEAAAPSASTPASSPRRVLRSPTPSVEPAAPASAAAASSSASAAQQVTPSARPAAPIESSRALTDRK